MEQRRLIFRCWKMFHKTAHFFREALDRESEIPEESIVRLSQEEIMFYYRVVNNFLDSVYNIVYNIVPHMEDLDLLDLNFKE